MARRLALAFALVLTACAGGTAKRGGLSEQEVATLPAEIQAPYQRFSTKCSRCHTLDRAMDPQITDYGHWESYVARMRLQPGSGISKADGETILIYLKHLAEQNAAAAASKPAAQ